MSDWDQFCVVKKLTKLEGELAEIRFPASGSLYLCESMADDDVCIALDRTIDPSGQFCVGPSCERGWYAQGKKMSLHCHLDKGPCEWDLVMRFLN